MHALPKDTVRLISSSQVVSSVCSGVKDLLENSLDAGATSIDIRLENFGLDLIEVKDNGCGVSRKDVQCMAKRHHTSKISSHSDLLSLTTYGFRGEALGSLASVGELTVTTRPRGADMGHIYKFNNTGDVTSEVPSHFPQGTSVAVTKLFKYLPVRKQLYASLSVRRSELRRLQSLLVGYGIICPNVRLCLKHDRSIVWQKGACSDCLSALAATIGTNVAKCMQHEMRSVDALEGTSIEFFLPSVQHRDQCLRSASDQLYVFVNKRPVVLKEVEKLIKEYVVPETERALQPRYPVGMVSVTVPPHSVDVNLEPNKMTVLLQSKDKILVCLREMLESLYGKPQDASLALDDAGQSPDVASIDDINTSNSLLNDSSTSSVEGHSPQSGECGVSRDAAPRQKAGFITGNSNVLAPALFANEQSCGGASPQRQCSSGLAKSPTNQDGAAPVLVHHSLLQAGDPEHVVHGEQESTACTGRFSVGTELPLAAGQAAEAHICQADGSCMHKAALTSTSGVTSRESSCCASSGTSFDTGLQLSLVACGRQLSSQSELAAMTSIPAPIMPSAQTSPINDRDRISDNLAVDTDHELAAARSEHWSYGWQLPNDAQGLPHVAPAAAEEPPVRLAQTKLDKIVTGLTLVNLPTNDSINHDRPPAELPRGASDASSSAKRKRKFGLESLITTIDDVLTRKARKSLKDQTNYGLAKHTLDRRAVALDFSLESLKKTYGSLLPQRHRVDRDVANDARLIGTLFGHASGYICLVGNTKIAAFNPYRLKEKSIFLELMDGHVLPSRSLAPPLTITPTLLGDVALWHALENVHAEMSQLGSPYADLVDDRLARNGLQLRRNVISSEIELLSVPCWSGPQSNGIAELREALTCRLRSGTQHCALAPGAEAAAEWRPLRVVHYLQAEAVRAVRAMSAPCALELVSLLKDAVGHSQDVSNEPGTSAHCIHGRPALTEIYALPTT